MTLQALLQLLKDNWAKAPLESRLILVATLAMALGLWVLSYKVPFGTIALYSIGALVVGFLASLVASAARNAGGVLLSGFVAWSLAGLFIATLVGFFVGAFTPWLPQATKIVSSVLGIDLAPSPPAISVTPSAFAAPAPADEQQPPAVLLTAPAAVSALPTNFRPLDLPENPSERLAALRRIGDLRIAGAQLTADGATSNFVAARRLVLDHATLLTNGFPLTIEVVDLEVHDGGRILSFADANSPTAGQPGASVGAVRIIVHGKILGQLDANLAGQKGATGSPGGVGAEGPGGSAGDNAASHAFDCAHGAGNGGPGGTGGKGLSGGEGLRGGNGGELTIVSPNGGGARAISFVAPGGAGGAGGEGGAGGQGGPGGAGGRADPPWCRGDGHDGPRGQPGPVGDRGAEGVRGNDGHLVNVPL